MRRWLGVVGLLSTSEASGGSSGAGVGGTQGLLGSPPAPMALLRMSEEIRNGVTNLPLSSRLPLPLVLMFPPVLPLKWVLMLLRLPGLAMMGRV